MDFTTFKDVIDRIIQSAKEAPVTRQGMKDNFLIFIFIQNQTKKLHIILFISLPLNEHNLQFNFILQ